jgi:hypothetical protein
MPKKKNISQQKKQELAEKIISGETTEEAVSKKYGFAVSTIKRWVNTVSKGDENALVGAYGRPSEYKPEYCEIVLEFFNKPDREVLLEPKLDKDDKPILNADGSSVMTPVINKYGEPVTLATRLPTIEGLARNLKVVVATIYHWADTHPDFLEALTRGREAAKDILISNALSKSYDPKFAQFVAINTTDMVNTVHVNENTNPLDVMDAMEKGLARARKDRGDQ